MPPLIPVTIPVALPTLPAPTLALQFPPVGPLNVRLLPLHIAPVPVIATGTGFTVTIAVALHPVPVEKVTVVVPVSTPVTTHVGELVEPKIVIAPLPALHNPLPLSDKVVVLPWHTCSVPPITPGDVFTVTVFVV